MNIFQKILDLLTLQEKRRALYLFILILMTASIDAMGVASILPFIGILLNAELIETNKLLSFLYNKSNYIGISNHEQFLFAVGIVVLFILISSLLIRTISNYFQIRFALMREYSIGRRLFEGYLSQPYSWFLNKNSADFGKNILSQVSSVIHQAIIPVINLIAQSTIVIAMLTLVIIADPEVALGAGSVLFLSYGGIFYLVKKYLSNIGAESVAANQNRFREFNDAFGSIKELKLNRAENNYIKRYSKPAETYAKNLSIAYALTHTPRYIIEGIAFGGMISLVLFLMSKKGNFAEIIPLITLYAFVGYRLIPATQMIYSSIATIRFSGPALENLHNDLINLKQASQKKISLAQSISFNNSIDLKNINFCYSGSTALALKNINIQIPAFSKIGIVGSTGSGKTTLIDLILGLLDVSQGTIKVDNNIINEQNIRSWQKQISYVPQQIFLSDNSIAENIAFGQNLENIEIQTVEAAAKIANLHEFVSSKLPKKYKTVIGERGVRLSGGQRQRIGIARAFYKNPKILILDEATSALDSLTEKKIMNNIQNLEKKFTIIIVAHRLSTIKNCDKIFILENGEIKDQGTYRELITNNKSFMKMASN
jgi:ABC-type multidrug transport system fused ATPase/permease subunit